MELHQFRIGLSVYTLNPLMESFYQKRGTVSEVKADLAEGKVIVEFDGNIPTTEFLPKDLTTVKPMSYAQIRVHVAELQDELRNLSIEALDKNQKIETVEAQAVERSRQLEMARGLADEHAETIKRKDARILQANNQILRHEESLKTIRASNEVLRGTNETLMEKNANLERGLTAANAALEAAQKSNDDFANEAVKQAEKVGALQRHNNHLTEQAGLRDRIIAGWEERSEKDTSIITSLRSQIESLQSIQASQKLMIDGNEKAVKSLASKLHTMTHQRDQFKQNAFYWRGIADKLGYNHPGITADKLPPTYEARIAKIEAFLGQQFESFN